MIRSRTRLSGKVDFRIVLGCSVLAFFAFFILAQTGVIPNFAARKVIAAHHERVLAQAARIESLHDIAANAVAKSEPWDDASVQKITGVPVTAANTAAMHIENLENAGRNLKYPRAMPVCFCDPFEITAAVSLARTGKWPGNEKVSFDASTERIEEIFKTMEQLQYVIVVRQSLYDAPTLTSDLGRFSSGAYRADAFLFEISTGRMLGSFDFSAANSTTFETTLTEGQDLTNEMLEGNLSSNAASAFQNRLAEFLPTAASAKEKW